MGLLSNWLLRREFDWCHIKMFNFAGIKCRFISSCPGSPLSFSMSGFNNHVNHESPFIQTTHLKLMCKECHLQALLFSMSHPCSAHPRFSWSKTTVAQPSRSLEVRRVCCTDRLIDMLLHMQWVSDGDLGVWLPILDYEKNIGFLQISRAWRSRGHFCARALELLWFLMAVVCIVVSPWAPLQTLAPICVVQKQTIHTKK